MNNEKQRKRKSEIKNQQSKRQNKLKNLVEHDDDEVKSSCLRRVVLSHSS